MGHRSHNPISSNTSPFPEDTQALYRTRKEKRKKAVIYRGTTGGRASVSRKISETRRAAPVLKV